MKTRLTEQFGIRHPNLSAPMALVAGGRLAAAVSDAGGLGILGGGYAGALGGEPDLEKELALAKGRKFGLGFITWALDRTPQALDEVLQHSPYCVFLSFGEPKPHAKKTRDAGAKLVCRCKVCGMSSKRSTLPLVPEVADYLGKRAPETKLLGCCTTGPVRQVSSKAWSRKPSRY